MPDGSIMKDSEMSREEKYNVGLVRLSSATSSDLSDVSSDSDSEADEELDNIDAFIKDIEDRGKPISTISPISKQYDSDESLEGSDFDDDDKALDDLFNEVALQELQAEDELEAYKKRGGYDPTPDPQSLFNYEAPIKAKVPSWAKSSRRGLGSAPIFKDIPVLDEISMSNKLDDFLKSQGREIDQPQVDEAYDVGFVLEDPTPLNQLGSPIRPRIRRREKQFGVTRQRRVALPPERTTKQLLQDAGVGKLSLGGAKNSYRLKDFEARRPPPNPQGIPVLQMLLKNNRKR